MVRINKKHLIGAVGLAGLLLISLSSYGLYTSTRDSHTIKFASEIYPPFTITHHDNKELQGFDIEVAKTLCDILVRRCTFSDSKRNQMYESLKTHKYDAWINAITITNERKDHIAFTNPYFSTKAMLIASSNTLFTAAPSDIKGKTIGMGEHTCYIHYLNKTYKNIINIRMFKSRNEALDALEKGMIDAVIDDDIAVKHWRLSQKDPKKYRLIGLPAKFKELRDHKYGIAVAKDNPSLLNELNHAIKHLKDDGFLEKLAAKHFSR
jgi:ABC-type amino acid transport substrate-binding protein